MNELESQILQRQMRLVGHIKHLDVEYRKTMSVIDDKYLNRIRKLLDAMTDRDKIYFQQNKKTKRAVALRKALDDWAREYRDVLKIDMASAYDTIYSLENKAIPGKRTKSVDKQPRLILGATVSAVAATSALRWRKYVDSSVKQGFSDGIEVYRVLAGSAKARLRDGAIFTRDRSAENHIGNAVMTGANDGRMDAWIQLDAKAYKWISTLDVKTCTQCSSLDGRVWKTKDITITPPAHSRCRCDLVRHDGEPDSGIQRGALEDDELKPKWRQKNGKKIPNPDRIDAYLVDGDTTFKKWFPSTSPEFQKEYLGPSRYKAWKDGDFKFDQFTDKNTGRMYTLDELNIERIY